MARTGRKKSSIGAYHVIIRGQKNLFPSDNDIFEFFNITKKYFDNQSAILYAYSLEDKKIHLVLKSAKELNEVMKPLCTCYARYYNRTYNKQGKLFYDRYMSEPLENSDEICDCVIFVHSKNTKNTSINEYTSKSELCAVDEMSKYHNKILEGTVKRFFNDDYASMSENELKKYLLKILNKKPQQLSKNEMEEFLGIFCANSNLSKARACRLLTINVSKAKNITKREPSANKNSNNKKPDRELSVWLL